MFGKLTTRHGSAATRKVIIEKARTPAATGTLAGSEAMQTIVKVHSKTEIVNPDPVFRSKVRQQLTTQNPAYAEAVKHGRWTGNIAESLQFYSEIPGSILVPRGWTRHALKILSKQGCDFIVEDHRLYLEELSLAFNGGLRPYQAKAVSEVLTRESGVLEAATGAGKTVIALAVIAERKQPAIILVHTKELLNQWVERIKSFLDIKPGMVGAGKMNIQPVTVAMVQSARKHLSKLSGRFGHLVVDECHRTPSTTFQEVVNAFDCRFLLGLSATAYRRDGLSRLIFLTLGDRIHKVDPAELQAAGAVLAPEIITRENGFTYFYNDDYQAMISELVTDSARNGLIAKDIEENINQGVALVVSDRVDHLYTLAGMVQVDGIEILTGSTSANERTRIVKDLNDGKVRVLFATVQLLGEGFDCYGLTGLYLTTPIRYHGRIIQVAGRILRPAPGKQALIYDYQDTKQPLLKTQARTRHRALAEMAGAYA